jgi:hypothetical protein
MPAPANCRDYVFVLVPGDDTTLAILGPVRSWSFLPRLIEDEMRHNKALLNGDIPCYGLRLKNRAHGPRLEVLRLPNRQLDRIREKLQRELKRIAHERAKLEMGRS